ncbi:hypothetical protein MPL3365_30309 [Mesorhizobium plurifarium]|uniref:Uncharacterized protein n=1 Tax=Mesorhizobium plurifarium TaxID=69974 RepID=A0A090G7I8_MESPL|nr:hypothetical protein MPL3365_30309 [Mesorhizobium plurifarium]
MQAASMLTDAKTLQSLNICWSPLLSRVVKHENGRSARSQKPLLRKYRQSRSFCLLSWLGTYISPPKKGVETAVKARARVLRPELG